MARHRLAFSRWLKHNIIISSCPLALAASNCSLQTAGQRRRQLICMQCDQHENKAVCWPSHKPSSGEITAHKAGQHMRMLQLIYMPRFQWLDDVVESINCTLTAHAETCNAALRLVAYACKQLLSTKRAATSSLCHTGPSTTPHRMR